MTETRTTPPIAVDEHRFKALSTELRCLVCQNQTLADSNADLAQDLRNEVREQMALGRSDQQIKDFLVQRYGDFVLYSPPLKDTTWPLWAGPFALLALGVGAWWAVGRRRRLAATAPSAGGRPRVDETGAQQPADRQRDDRDRARRLLD